MTADEIRAAIDASPVLAGLLPDAAAVAAALSVGRTKIVNTLGGVGLVMEHLGPLEGSAVLDTLDQLKTVSAPVRWACVLVERGDLDFGSPATRMMIEQLGDAGAISEASAAAMLAIAEVPDPVSEFEVQRAIYGAGGSMVTETSKMVDGNGETLAEFDLSADMGGVSLTFRGIWHSPTLLDQYAAKLNELAQKLRDAGVP